MTQCQSANAGNTPADKGMCEFKVRSRIPDSHGSAWIMDASGNKCRILP